MRDTMPGQSLVKLTGHSANVFRVMTLSVLTACCLPTTAWSGEFRPCVVREFELSDPQPDLLIPALSRRFAFSSDMRFVAAGNGEFTEIRYLRSGKLFRRWRKRRSIVFELAFSPNSHLLAEAVLIARFPPEHPVGKRDSNSRKRPISAAEVIELRSIASGRLMTTFKLQGSAVAVSSLSFSPDGKLLATAVEKQVVLRDVRTGKVQRILRSSQPIRLWSFDISSSSPLLTYVTSSGKIPVWNYHTGRLRTAIDATTQTEHNSVTPVKFSPDGTMLAYAKNDGTVALCNIADGKTVAMLRGRKDNSPINDIAFSPNGKLLAAGGGPLSLFEEKPSPEDVTIWDLSSHQIQTHLRHPTDILRIEFLPCGHCLATIDFGGHLRLWRLTADR